MPDDGYRLWTLVQALGLHLVSDHTAVSARILERLPGGHAERDLPAVYFIVREVLDDDTAWIAVTGGSSVVDWRSLELGLETLRPAPKSAPSRLVSLVLLHIESALQAKSRTN